MRGPFGTYALGAFFGGLLFVGAKAQMKVSSFDGPVTKEELKSFNDYVVTLKPATDNKGNQWVQGHSGEQTKAMGLVYQMAGQQETLDHMLRFCDAVLSERNDLAKAPVGQHKIWTGGIDPVWPNDVTKKPTQTGGGRRRPLWRYLYGSSRDLSQAGGFLDEQQYLKTITGSFERKQDVLCQGLAYMGGKPVPWNQQMMFNYAFMNLCSAHRILNDNPELLGKYKSILTASIDWFFHGGGVQTKKSKKGSTVYDWCYTVLRTTGEDSNHGALDVAGFYRTYIDGNYDITADQMKPFANMFVDVMTLGKEKYVGTVDGKTDGDGHAKPTKNIRSGYLFLAEFWFDACKSMMSADLSVGGKGTGSADGFSRFLWVKNQRAKAK
ncbi:uncharacterized protein F4817DRAFT_369149 [Daldinia loculata]|uniref:uncharacterized protein n=1 Tax=Daldinia loculata TaxID=103429 RepID=UPI0020C1EA0E|nr:uncharacterized protein F4817DRAFT_369149 [Daldinia loculata]KAI1642707.1 hypothetical protein F4817DRAFT_369149 [Daldinia loculata]